MTRPDLHDRALPAAALDIGTNTVLLVVGRRAPDGGLEILEDHSRTARLGQGLAQTGRLNPQAVERTLGILVELLARADACGVARARVWAVGTAVLRRAQDASTFLEAARERFGLAVQVISEEEEARLGYRAVVGAGGPADTTIVDVGGGSTEVVTDGGECRLSAPVGALVLTEKYLDGKGGGWPALLTAVAGAVRVFPRGAAAGREVVLLGGAVSNLACLELGLAEFDHTRAEGARVGAEAAGRWAEELRGRTLEQRRSLPIEADRAEILPAGLACVAATLERLEAVGGRVTGKGLRYGVLDERIQATSLPPAN